MKQQSKVITATTDMKLLYIAGAYSGNTIQNIKDAEQVSINLIRNGFHVLTPHKNTAGYEKYEGDGLDYETWIKMDMDLLSRCDAIYIMVNSTNSIGAMRELEFARQKGMVIILESEHPSHMFTLETYLGMRLAHEE